MSSKIHINQLGYMVGMPKTAVCVVTASVFYIVDAQKGTSVYAGRLSHSGFDKESGDSVRRADFSDFNTTGKFFIRAGYRKSDVFEIKDTPYRDIRRDILDGIYYNRCGFDFFRDGIKEKDSRLFRPACHTISAKTESGADLSGGWHADGGYSRSVLSASSVIAALIYSARLFPNSFSGNDMDDIESECRWGLDWLLKMQDSDGGVFSDITKAEKDYSVAPEDDTDEYSVGRKTIGSTLRFTAVTALASEWLSGTDRTFSRTLRRAAEKSWIWAVQSHEASQRSSASSDDKDFTDAELMWAICEMYSLTGNESFGERAESKFTSSEYGDLDFDTAGGYAALSYLLSERAGNNSVKSAIISKITDTADRMCIPVENNRYGTSRSAGNFTVDSNYNILSDCMVFIMAYLVSGEHRYLCGAGNQLAFICGCNPLGKVYITGEDSAFVHCPCHSIYISSDNELNIRGMVVGGANTRRTDDFSKWHIGKDTPPARCYIDSAFSISTNEPAVHYSAPMVFISAFYDKVGRSALSSLRKAREQT